MIRTHDRWSYNPSLYLWATARKRKKGLLVLTPQCRLFSATLQSSNKSSCLLGYLLLVQTLSPQNMITNSFCIYLLTQPQWCTEYIRRDISAHHWVEIFFRTEDQSARIRDKCDSLNAYYFFCKCSLSHLPRPKAVSLRRWITACLVSLNLTAKQLRLDRPHCPACRCEAPHIAPKYVINQH